MSRLPQSWRALRSTTSRRLGWKLAISHLKVTLIAQAINLAGVGLILVSFGQVSAPFTSGELAEVTRALATALAGPVAARSPDLSATLARLPSQGAAEGVLLPATALVIVSPDGEVLASSTRDVPVGAASARLEPAAWGHVLDAARRGERDGASPALTRRDSAMGVFVSAYPIVDDRGELLGALGLRSAPVPPGPPENEGAVLVSLTVIFGTLFLIVSAISSGVAAAIGVLLARAFGQRLQALARATEAIARGDLAARVAVTEPDEIGQIAVRFNQLTERLDQIDSARRSFVSNISHELRTPLAIIRGHVEAQLASDAGAAPSREALEAIDREARALGTLIDDLFTLTRIEEASLPLQTRPVAAQEIAAEAASGIRALASRQGHVAVHSIVPADLPPVLADPARLAQILNNLLYNALRHTPDGGVIVIEGAPTPDGAAIELAVSDTGVGIAPSDLPHIFDRFFRGQGDNGVGGSGLGLAIVKQLVQAQGGAIRAESAPGRGTTIRFTLPRAGAEPAKEGAVAPPET